jgi:hypothetical protein
VTPTVIDPIHVRFLNGGHRIAPTSNVSLLVGGIGLGIAPLWLLQDPATDQSMAAVANYFAAPRHKGDADEFAKDSQLKTRPGDGIRWPLLAGDGGVVWKEENEPVSPGRLLTSARHLGRIEMLCSFADQLREQTSGQSKNRLRE